MLFTPSEICGNIWFDWIIFTRELKMIKIVICDDEDIYIEQIRMLVSDLLEKIPVLFSMDICSSGEELVRNLQNGSIYDIALLDMRMDGICGIEVADILRKQFQHDKTILIYITAYDDRIRETFQFGTHRFLAKPIERLLFDDALLSAIQLWEKQQSTCYAFKDIKLGHVKILLKDILYFESNSNHYVDVITTNYKYTICRIKLSNIHEKLFSSDFIRIHHSALVNFDHIKIMNYDEVTMSNEEVLRISGPKKKDVRNLFSKMRKSREQNPWL